MSPFFLVSVKLNKGILTTKRCDTLFIYSKERVQNIKYFIFTSDFVYKCGFHTLLWTDCPLLSQHVKKFLHPPQTTRLKRWLLCKESSQNKDHQVMSTNLDQYYNNYYYKKFGPPRIDMKLWQNPYLLGGGGGGGGAPLDGGGGGGVALTPLGFPEDLWPPESKDDILAKLKIYC